MNPRLLLIKSKTKLDSISAYYVFHVTCRNIYVESSLLVSFVVLPSDSSIAIVIMYHLVPTTESFEVLKKKLSPPWSPEEKNISAVSLNNPYLQK
jgi:hypothetical protein